MLNVRYDYGFLGKLFGVPRKLLSQLGGFCSSFTVEGRILKATFPAFPVPDKNPVKFWLDEEELAAFIEEQGGATPEDLTHDDITDWDAATADFLDVDDYETLSGAIDDLSGVVDDILSEMSSFLTVGDIGVTVASESHTHDEYLTDADLDGYALENDLLDLTEEVVDMDLDILDLTESIEMIIDDIYDESGNLNFVTTDTYQEISGMKVFYDNVSVMSDLPNTAKYFIADNVNGSRKSLLGNGDLYLDSSSGPTVWFRNYAGNANATLAWNSSYAGLTVYKYGTGKNYFIVDDFRSPSIYDYAKTIIGDGNLYLDRYSNNSIFFRDYSGNNQYASIKWDQNCPGLIIDCGGPNKLFLNDHPTVSSSNKDTKTIPTCGWVASNFAAYDPGNPPFTGNKDRCEGVHWDGAILKYKKFTDTYVNGLLISSTDGGFVTIDTPVVYSPT